MLNTKISRLLEELLREIKAVPLAQRAALLAEVKAKLDEQN
jgi:hypothetical protein